MLMVHPAIQQTSFKGYSSMNQTTPIRDGLSPVGKVLKTHISDDGIYTYCGVDRKGSKIYIAETVDAATCRSCIKNSYINKAMP